MEMSVSSETTFFNMKLQLEICPQLRTGSSVQSCGTGCHHNIVHIKQVHLATLNAELADDSKSMKHLRLPL